MTFLIIPCVGSPADDYAKIHYSLEFIGEKKYAEHVRRTITWCEADSSNSYVEIKIPKIIDGSELKKGDLVFMNGKYQDAKRHVGEMFEVASEPQMIGGTWCVFLKGYRGAYAMDGLTKAEQSKGDAGK